MAERRRLRKQAQQTPSQVTLPFEVPIHWQSEPQVPTSFANQIVLQAQEGQLIITFEMVATPYQQPTEELKARLKTEGLPIVPVAKIVMGLHKMKDLIGAFADLDRLLNAQNREGGQPQ